MRRTYIILFSLALLGMIAVAASALCGSSGCVAGPDFDEMLWQLRFPRTVSAFAVGGLLALSGALMQILLRNPLADPYVLGVSGGAAVGAMGSSLLASAGLLGLSARWSMHAGALIGALAATW